MTFFDPETNFFEKSLAKSFIFSYNLSTFGDVRNLTPYHMPPNALEWAQGFFSNFKKYLDKT